MPSGEGCTGSARCAQRWNGCQGGPPNGYSAAPPSDAASASMTRRDQRSSGSGAPSRASGEAAKAGQPIFAGEAEQHQRAAGDPVPEARMECAAQR